jgi:hypothetical protein
MIVQTCTSCSLTGSQLPAADVSNTPFPLADRFEIFLIHLPPRNTTNAIDNNPRIDALLIGIEEIHALGATVAFVPVSCDIADVFFEAVRGGDSDIIASVANNLHIPPEVSAATVKAHQLGLELFSLWPKLPLTIKPQSGYQAQVYASEEFSRIVTTLNGITTPTDQKIKVAIIHYEQISFNDTIPTSLCKMLRNAFPNLEVNKCRWFNMGIPNYHNDNPTIDTDRIETHGGGV